MKWIGQKDDLGLAVISFNEYYLARDVLFAPRYELFLPIKVSGPMSCNILAVWAYNHRSSLIDGKRRKSATYDAITYYEDFLRQRPSLVAGDFNSNPSWPKAKRPKQFSETVEIFDKLGLTSAYHTWTNEIYGSETQPTLLFRKSTAKPKHIDYCFLPVGWSVTSVTILSGEYWTSQSDHFPLVVDIGFEP